MTKPLSIGRFEWFWWSATALWALGARLVWDRNRSALLADPRTRAVADWGQWFWIGVTLLFTILLWWLVARRASTIGKWLVVIWAGLDCLLALVRVVGLVNGRTLHPVGEATVLLTLVLSIAAAAMLFREDARRWFGEFDDVADEERAA